MYHFDQWLEKYLLYWPAQNVKAWFGFVFRLLVCKKRDYRFEKIIAKNKYEEAVCIIEELP